MNKLLRILLYSIMIGPWLFFSIVMIPEIPFFQSYDTEAFKWIFTLPILIYILVVDEEGSVILFSFLGGLVLFLSFVVAFV
ncbi:hypothetical protein [Metabacillus iocasae]|uniref:NADH dehydrogenase subunit 4 n=1 Tax=Priestia iocasae TaxID=2291674 RepID=A0ABS2QU79_9BACI|nr:hypothetical protein [Metabacillus iocasae]MBM7702977.1 hypothetical protein [Metabacillus iocasae]